MPREFYLDLSEDVIALCEELLHRAAEWHLPIRRKENFIGFGKSHGFYMFWIAYKDGIAYFKARRTYDYNSPEEVYHLVPENKEAILAAVEHIYQEYLATPDRIPVVQKSAARQSLPPCPSLWSKTAESAVLSRREGAQNTADLSRAAREFSRLADAQLQFLLCGVADARQKTSEKYVNIWKEYVLFDTNTLRSIAPEYEISHERIRRIVKKIDKRLNKLFQKYCLHDDCAEFTERNAQMMVLLNGGDGALVPFLCECFADWGKRKRACVLSLLFGEEAAKTLWKECEAHQKAELSLLRAQKIPLQKVARLQEMIQYPTQVYADTQKQISSFAEEKEFLHLTKFRKRLEELQDYLCFVQTPNIVYYSSSQTDHRPNFLLEWKNDGRRVLVMVLPTINMAYSYNLTRFRALRDYCEKNGYGYLIVNDRDQSFEEVKRFPVSPELQTALDAILFSKGKIFWSDILALRATHKVTNALIAAYVLQNGLRFVTSPYFCICRFYQETGSQ